MHAYDAFKVVKKQEVADLFAWGDITFFFFVLSTFLEWALPHYECNPECGFLPVCLPVCLSAAEGVPTARDSLEAELW